MLNRLIYKHFTYYILYLYTKLPLQFIVTIVLLHIGSLFLPRSNESAMVQCATVGNHHRKSNSLDAGMGKQMKQQSSRDRYV